MDVGPALDMAGCTLTACPGSPACTPVRRTALGSASCGHIMTGVALQVHMNHISACPWCRRIRRIAGIRTIEHGDGGTQEVFQLMASQGVALLVGGLPEVPLVELCRVGKAPRTIVALDGVEDPRNVGAIVRVAEACGASGLLLTRRRAPPRSPSGPTYRRSATTAATWCASRQQRSIASKRTFGSWRARKTGTGSSAAAESW